MSVPPEPTEQPTEPEPVEPARPRSVLGSGPRDLLISMAILLPIIGLVALIGRGCSFSPGGPTVDPNAVQAIDPKPALVGAAPHLGFPVRLPSVPPGWRSTAVDLGSAPGQQPAARVSWITAGGRYLKLVQSRADEGALVMAEGRGSPTGAGPVTVGGAQWVVYSDANNEQTWARRVDGVEWLITGDGQRDEFIALATSVAAARPL